MSDNLVELGALQDERERARNGTSSDPGAQLNNLLKLDLAAANVFGTGVNAKVDLILRDGRTITFPRYSDITKGSALAAHLVTHATT